MLADCDSALLIRALETNSARKHEIWGATENKHSPEANAEISRLQDEAHQLLTSLAVAPIGTPHEAMRVMRSAAPHLSLDDGDPAVLALSHAIDEMEKLLG